MFLPTLLLMLLAAISASLATSPYYCSLCPDHTMCKYQGMGKNCQSYYVRGVDKEQRELILHKHNLLRSYVAMGQETRGLCGGQPTACNMQKLTWSNELASIAQRWADQCEYYPDVCRITKFYCWVGQNIAMGSTWPCDDLPRANWNVPMEGWYNEVQNFDKDIIPKYRWTCENTCHYTQIVWANTSEIGCGYTAFFGPQNEEKKCFELYVCNYGMGGNLNDSEVYEIGPPRGACPDTTEDWDYPGLCPN